MKKIFLGIFFICLNAFSGASLDTITKFLGSSSFMWYHYWSISNIFGLILFFIFISFRGGIKKHLVLESKGNYIIPVLRGIAFVPGPIIIFFSLKHIPLNIFTSIIITMPFFIFIFSKLLQKEKISIINWLILLVGFMGAILVIKPNFNTSNIFIILMFYIPVVGAILNVIVSKYSEKASAYGYAFYFILPITLVSSLIFIYDPIAPSDRELLLLFGSGLCYILVVITWNAAYHISGKYSSIISPFIYTQIIWASIFGIIFFVEKLDFLAILGIGLIVATGTITILITPKKIN